MREMDAFEQAYLNGYKAGRKDAVRHGMWIDISKRVFDYDGDWIATQFCCSSCGRVEYKKEPYCNCGCKMDEN